MRLSRRIFSAVIGVSLVLFLCASPGFPASIPDIAILISSDVPYYQQAVDGFRRIFPSHVRVEEYHLQGSLAKGRQIGETVRADQPDLVLAVGLKAALASHLEIPDIPVIFCLVLNPALHDLPAPNMTGILMQPSNAQNFETMQAVLPQARRIGLLYHPDRSGDFVTQAKRDAPRFGLTLIVSGVRDQADVPETVRELLPQIDLLWVTQDSTVLTPEAIDFLLTSSFDAKVPIYTFAASLVQRGALAGIILNPFDIGQQAGRLARKVLQGDARPHLTLVPPAMTSLALNLNSAEYFGVHTSPKVMRMAGVLFGPGAVAQSDLPWTPVP